eukprot:6971552-Prymnesium_polylepis.1
MPGCWLTRAYRVLLLLLLGDYALHTAPPRSSVLRFSPPARRPPPNEGSVHSVHSHTRALRRVRKDPTSTAIRMRCGAR